MKEIFKYIFLSLLFFSCKKENELKIKSLDYNPFEVSAEQTDKESNIRRSFFESTGVYLTFSDTLKHKLGTKIIDFANNFTITEDRKYLFSYIKQDEQKQIAANFVKSGIISKLRPDARPYSILLIEKIKMMKIDKELGPVFSNDKLKIKENFRSTALAQMEQLETTNDTEKEKLRTEIMTVIVKSRLMEIAKKDFESFYKISEEYYGLSTTDAAKIPNISNLGEIGFIGSYEFKPGKKARFWRKDDDRKKTIERYMEDFYTQKWKSDFSEYPLVLEKFEIIDEIVNEHIILEK